MADPPPPSYDDAITRDYLSPPEPSSYVPPPSFPESSPAPALIPEPTAPLASDRETSSVSPEREQPETFANRRYFSPEPEEQQRSPEREQPETVVYRRSFFPEPQEQQRVRQTQITVDVNEETGTKKVTSYACCLFIVICCLLVSLYFWLPRGTDSSNSSSICKDLPKIPGAVKKYCPINKYGSYDLDLSCTYECPQGYSLFGKKRDNDKDWKDLKTSYFYIFCVGHSNWTSFELREKICEPNETRIWSKCKTNPRIKLECHLTPPNPDDCKKPPPKIEKSTWIRCPQNLHGQYSKGTRCSYKCENEYVLANSKGPLDGHLVKSETYTCKGSQWVSTEGGNRTLQCVTLRQFLKETLSAAAELGISASRDGGAH